VKPGGFAAINNKQNNGLAVFPPLLMPRALALVKKVKCQIPEEHFNARNHTHVNV